MRIRRFGKAGNKSSGNDVNRKVKNARKVIFDGIEFNSDLEMRCYILLKSSGLDFSYECERVILMSGWKETDIVIWKLGKDGALKKGPVGAVRDWTYTPDFVILSKDGKKKVYVEMKGNPTDLTPYKQKMFIRYLSILGKASDKKFGYALLRNIKQLAMLIENLKKEEEF